MLMKTTRTLVAAATGFLLVGCGASSRTTNVEAGDVAVSPNAPAVTPINNRVLPAGATLSARLDQALGTTTSKAGDMFMATVTNALIAQDGSVAIPAGAKIHGRVTALDDSDNATEPALIRLDFERISFGGQSYPFKAAIVQSNPVQTSNQTGADRTRQVVIGGAVGAALGGLLSGGDLDKIVIGGALGAAAGSVVSLGTEVNATLPAGSMMTLRVTETTTLR